MMVQQNSDTGIGLLVASRALQAVLVALIVGVVSFIMMETLPGDTAFRIAASRYGYDALDSSVADAVRVELGLNAPAWQRFAWWVGDLVTFDLGRSLVTGDAVAHEVSTQLGASVELAFVALVLSLVIALPVGIIAGLNPGGWVDRISLAVSILFRSVPVFALGVVLILIFAVKLRLLPVAGYGEARHFALPAIALALVLAAVTNRVVRDAVIEVAGSPYMHFARLKGLSEARAFSRHAPRNIVGPLAAFLGVQAALLIEGVVVIESVFSWPGIGHALVHALFARDVPVVQGAALVLGFGFVAIGAVADLTARFADPRPTELG